MDCSVLIADTHSLYREGLVRIIDSWNGFNVVGDAADGIDVIEKTRELSPDMVLMDSRLALIDSIEVATTLTRECPHTAIAFMTMEASEEELIAAIVAGVRGYLLKDTHIDELETSLRSISAGQRALSRDAVATCFNLVRRSYYAGNLDGSRAAKLKLSLTARERELLHCITLGESNKEIGSKLYMGESTVKKQVSNLLTKLGMENRTQAAVFALRTGIVN